jgi:hypothetical protein
MAAYAEDDNIPVTPDNIVQGAPIGLVRDNVAEEPMMNEEEALAALNNAFGGIPYKKTRSVKSKRFKRKSRKRKRSKRKRSKRKSRKRKRPKRTKMRTRNILKK